MYQSIDLTPMPPNYDYRTRRLQTTDDGTTTMFRYDGGDSFQELDAAGSLKVEFVRGSGMGGGIGSILYSQRGVTNEFFSYNAVGHTVALTLTNGTTEKTVLYEAFGNIASSFGVSANNRLANTKERSFSIGLDNHGLRYYDPEVGRYLTRDPIGYGDGMNVYLYAGGNPVNYIDPLGLSMDDPKNNIDGAQAPLPVSPKEASAISDINGTAYKPTSIASPERVNPVDSATKQDLTKRGEYEIERAKLENNLEGAPSFIPVLPSVMRARLAAQYDQKGEASIGMAFAALDVAMIWKGGAAGGEFETMAEGRLLGANAAASEVRGGTYLLRDPVTGQVMRTGRTRNLVRREAEHARDAELGDFKFEAVHRTDGYAEQRGLEQLLHKTYNPPLNKISPISPTNPNRQPYLNAAQQFLQGGNK